MRLVTVMLLKGSCKQLPSFSGCKVIKESLRTPLLKGRGLFLRRITRAGEVENVTLKISGDNSAFEAQLRHSLHIVNQRVCLLISMTSSLPRARSE